ncbi:RNA polymerase sigma factor [Frigoriglobus tundricola]|uniref:RNA polymerase ECF-type sigma factor n=1 Tax=Frigoriglobus tundricola TaxID=2774151 RepID=A0A6M5YLH6_9BACT|nr:RNA polymerase sigma factor [Frigoriglobus tundricola]QJW94153.1 hypothetical protein FTUN_1672 [Frigoriglobus tundricola]
MTQAGTQQPLAAPPDDPVRAALDDPELRNVLICHAVARLGCLLADRYPDVRRDTAEDAVQDVYKRVLEQRSRFDPNSGTVAAWMHGILNLVLHERCRAIRKQPAQPTADPVAWDGLAARMSDLDGVGDLTRLLDKLSEDHRRIVTLHHLDGLSHEQIAAQLGVSVGNSRLRLARAMRTLRDLGEQEGGR